MRAKTKDKNLVLLLIFGCFFSVLQGQITFDLVSEESMYVKNNYGYSMRVIVYYKYLDEIKFDEVLKPGERNLISYKYSKTTIDHFKYSEMYDSSALESDMKRVESMRNTRRRNRILSNIILDIVDQVFFDGKISSISGAMNYVDMFLHGATKGEWGEAFVETAVGYAINKSFDEEYERGIASGVFEVIKSIPEEDRYIKAYLRGLSELRCSNYSKKGKITDTAKLPSPNFIFSIEGAYPINQKFRESSSQKGIKSISIGPEKSGNTLPFLVRLNHYPDKRSRLFFEYGKTGIFRNTDSDKSQYLKINNAFRFSMYSLGIAPSLSILELGLGATYLEQENFSIDIVSEELHTTKTTNKWAFFIEPRINVNIGKYVSVFGSWKGNYFGDKEIDKTTFLLQSFKVGVHINLIKNGLDFSD